MTSYVLCKTGSLAVFKVTARDQGHYKGPSGAFVTYCNISCFYLGFISGETQLRLKIPRNQDIGSLSNVEVHFPQGWLAACSGFNSVLKISLCIEQSPREKEKEKKRKT